MIHWIPVFINVMKFSVYYLTSPPPLPQVKALDPTGHSEHRVLWQTDLSWRPSTSHVAFCVNLRLRFRLTRLVILSHRDVVQMQRDLFRLFSSANLSWLSLWWEQSCRTHSLSHFVWSCPDIRLRWSPWTMLLAHWRNTPLTAKISRGKNTQRQHTCRYQKSAFLGRSFSTVFPRVRGEDQTWNKPIKE